MQIQQSSSPQFSTLVLYGPSLPCVNLKFALIHRQREPAVTLDYLRLLILALPSGTSAHPEIGRDENDYAIDQGGQDMRQRN